jgi:hypothetical protein
MAFRFRFTRNIAIFANDYGEAAAIDFFGHRYGLPASLSKAEMYGSGIRVSMMARASSSLAAMAEATLSFSVQSNLQCGGQVFSRGRMVHHLPL